MLETGRSGSLDYDLKTSPLTVFMVKYIGFPSVRAMHEKCSYGSATLTQAFFQEIISPEDFLASCNTDLIQIIANGVGNLLVNRQAALFGSKTDKLGLTGID